MWPTMLSWTWAPSWPATQWQWWVNQLWTKGNGRYVCVTAKEQQKQGCLCPSADVCRPHPWRDELDHPCGRSSVLLRRSQCLHHSSLQVLVVASPHTPEGVFCVSWVVSASVGPRGHEDVRWDMGQRDTKTYISNALTSGPFLFLLLHLDCFSWAPARVTSLMPCPWYTLRDSRPSLLSSSMYENRFL